MLILHGDVGAIDQPAGNGRSGDMVAAIGTGFCGAQPTCHLCPDWPQPPGTGDQGREEANEILSERSVLW
jgi:hypothetical protein